ncbi:hypothetical protein M409DRAFT_29554 [Zasmidium cellare ATCC 36951]|uniref:Uncharacterized protein n=1 Tax=Zasmidium cellare ATCC 36951 TaxID=1080233 RepID=A0A6A6BZ06_ZASCE|nr:uncharacterized protein M409DRAFT_29554 [Zasmidium cellare ATCC 36951]KAF2159945.1 hypothetical protein M409DRAFT_29554 [Zasmidium cellare ATCC 36951]
MGFTNIKDTKTPTAFNTGHRKPTTAAAIVGTVEAPRGHDIGPSHTAQMTALNTKLQLERTTHGAMEGQIKIRQKEKEYLCLKIQRLDRQMERARQEHDVQLLKQYAQQQEAQVNVAEEKLYERHGIQYLYTVERARGKRRIEEVDTPARERGLSPPKAPRRPSSFDDKRESMSNGSKTSEEGKSVDSSQTTCAGFVDLSDTSTDTDDEL